MKDKEANKSQEEMRARMSLLKIDEKQRKRTEINYDKERVQRERKQQE